MISFPVYIRDDAGDITAYPSWDAMQRDLEAIDVENHEYEAWDGVGNALELSVGKPKSEWLKIKQSDRTLSRDEFAGIRGKAVPYREPEPLFRKLGRV